MKPTLRTLLLIVFGVSGWAMFIASWGNMIPVIVGTTASEWEVNKSGVVSFDISTFKIRSCAFVKGDVEALIRHDGHAWEVGKAVSMTQTESYPAFSKIAGRWAVFDAAGHEAPTAVLLRWTHMCGSEVYRSDIGPFTVPADLTVAENQSP